MNREIKFRAWDKAYKRFNYPDKGYQGHYVLTLNGEFYNLQNGSGGDDYVVQQYTGLKDKNGKEIYEGDVVDIVDNYNFDENYPKTHKIVFSDCRRASMINAFILKNVHGKECIWTWTELEVVGNIFENPELI